MTPKEFFDTYAIEVQKACEGTKIFPSVKLAQMALETGYGKSIRKAANNCYGIKAGKSWQGKVISSTTFEYINKVKTYFNGTGKIYISRNEALKEADFRKIFRVYNSISESIADHNKFLTENSRYLPVLNSLTPEEQCRQLKKCGYATGISYDLVLISIINKYSLKQYD